MEDPEPTAGSRVVPADVAFRVLLAARRRARPVSSPHDDDVARDDRRPVPGDLARHRVERLVGVLLEVDDAVPAEVLERAAGLRVEADQLVADGDVEDPLVALAVGPVADAAARQAADRGISAASFVEPVHPPDLARGSVHRHGVPRRAGGEVQHPVHHERRRLEVVVGTRAEVIGLEPPCDLERAEVLRVDLIEGCVARGAQVAGPRPPFAAGCTALGREADRRGEHGQGEDRRPPPELRIQNAEFRMKICAGHGGFRTCILNS